MAVLLHAGREVEGRDAVELDLPAGVARLHERELHVEALGLLGEYTTNNNEQMKIR